MGLMALVYPERSHIPAGVVQESAGCGSQGHRQRGPPSLAVTFPARRGGLPRGLKGDSVRAVESPVVVDLLLVGRPRSRLHCIGICKVYSGIQGVFVGCPANRTLSQVLPCRGNDDVCTHLRWGHCWKDSTLNTGSRCPSSKSTGGKIQGPALIAQEG